MVDIDTDVFVHVFHGVSDTAIGQSSRYASTEHPGSGNLIEGWKWDKRGWPENKEFQSAELAPSIWDATDSGLEEYFQSGYGDGDDLLLLDIEEVATTGIETWAPNILHGYFYIQDEEWYLFSDDYLTEYFTVTGIEDDQQVLTLSKTPKPTIPIMVRNFYYDRSEGRHTVDKDFRKRVSEFTISGEEFMVDTDFNPPMLILNGDFTRVVGQDIELSASGTVDPPYSTSELDIVGISDGQGGQEFYLTYSPIDPDADIEVWSWYDSNEPTEWTPIGPLDDFSVSGYEFKIDRDRGVISFGDHDITTNAGAGQIPGNQSTIAAYYTQTVAAFYEPENTRDDILAYSNRADVNPISSSISKGFVQVTTDTVDAASIVLGSSDLVLAGSNYLIQLGNNVGTLEATVRNTAGDVLEGQDVTFEILAPSIGTFGTIATIASAITNGNGVATTLYNSPLTAQQLGQVTTDVSHNGSDTLVDVTGLTEPTTVSGIYIYKIHEQDEVLGIPESGLSSYYNEFLDEQNITVGSTATQNWEVTHRDDNELLKPTTYASTEISVGKKTMMLTTRSQVVNPHTGEYDSNALVPILPDVITNIGTTESPILRMTYQNISFELPGGLDTKGYFVVGDGFVRIRAYVTNRRTGRKIYSNTITLEVQIPDTLNGTFFCNVLNDVPDGLLTKPKNVYLIPTGSISSTASITTLAEAYENEKEYIHESGVYESYVSWFQRTRRFDTMGLDLYALEVPDEELSGLEEIQIQDCPADIPLGFRLKSTGIVVASVLDQVTFLDPNDNLPSGYADL